MFCPKCGAKNDDTSMKCSKCGAELAGAAAAMAMATGSLPFEEGLTKALRTFGAGMLREPAKLKSTVADECDHNKREYIVFQRNCDSDLLEPYAQAVDKDDASEMARAATLGELHLNERRAEDAQTSRNVAQGIARSLAQICGMGPLDLHSDLGEKHEVQPPVQPASQTTAMPQVDAIPAAVMAASQTSSQQPVQSPQQTPYDAQQPKKGKVPIIIGAIAAIAAVLVVALLVVPQITSESSSARSSSTVTGASGNTITVSFDGGGADGGSMSQITCNSGDSVSVPKCGFTNKGYSFDRWKGDDGKTYNPGDTLMPNRSVMLTAIWNADSCTIKFLGAGADGGSTESISATSGSSVELPQCGFYRTGYDFDCWEGEDGSSYDPGDTATVTGDTTFAAQWKARSKSTSSSSTSSSSTSSSSDSITPSNMPRNWKGSYEGYTTHTAEGVITRAVTITFKEISSSGYISGIVYVGEAEMVEGVTHGSYNFEGSLDFKTGKIHMEGTTWVDKGGLIGVGGFNGTVNSSNWTMSGEWYDPEGEAQNGAWYMRAS